jgi:hypothetical protein
VVTTSPWPDLPRARRGFLFSFDALGATVLVGLAVYFGTNTFARVRFDRERIQVWAADGQVQVSGLYHYQNAAPLPASFSLGLPFPVDAAHPAPSLFSIAETSADGSTSKPVAHRTYHGDIVFRLWFASHEEKWIRVDYVQHVAARSGRYILLTTNQWHRPLDFGEYILHLGKGSELDASNYPLTAVALTRRSYSFFKTDFVPNQDWEFSWRPPMAPIVASRGTP